VACIFNGVVTFSPHRDFLISLCATHRVDKVATTLRTDETLAPLELRDACPRDQSQRQNRRLESSCADGARRGCSLAARRRHAYRKADEVGTN
jgi:hypothetical protein